HVSRLLSSGVGYSLMSVSGGSEGERDSVPPSKENGRGVPARETTWMSPGVRPEKDSILAMAEGALMPAGMLARRSVRVAAEVERPRELMTSGGFEGSSPARSRSTVTDPVRVRLEERCKEAP